MGPQRRTINLNRAFLTLLIHQGAGVPTDKVKESSVTGAGIGNRRRVIGSGSGLRGATGWVHVQFGRQVLLF